jgi:hypothetical protein
MAKFLVTEQTILTRTIEVEAPNEVLAGAVAVGMPTSAWTQAPMERPDMSAVQV